MIYPFKRMTGNQPADSANKTVLVPNLFGNVTTEPDAYWVKFDWGRAAGRVAILQLSTTGQPVQVGNDYEVRGYGHAVEGRPRGRAAEQAYGKDNGCADCHFSDQIDWTALGWTKDPATGGTQTLP